MRLFCIRGICLLLYSHPYGCLPRKCWFVNRLVLEDSSTRSNRLLTVKNFTAVVINRLSWAQSWTDWLAFSGTDDITCPHRMFGCTHSFWWRLYSAEVAVTFIICVEVEPWLWAAALQASNVTVWYSILEKCAAGRHLLLDSDILILTSLKSRTIEAFQCCRAPEAHPHLLWPHI